MVFRERERERERERGGGEREGGRERGREREKNFQSFYCKLERLSNISFFFMSINFSYASRLYD
jgi:hypothetical protein